MLAFPNLLASLLTLTMSALSRPSALTYSRLLLAVLFSIVIVAQSQACTNQNQKAMDQALSLMSSRQNLERAKNLLSEAERFGNVDAAYNLGIFFMEGYAGNKNDVEASKHFELAAKCGHTLAQFNLAQIYDSTLNSPALAAKWFKIAANSGHTISAFNLGNLYANGRGVPLSLDLARDYFSQAAESGHVDAMYNLGILFYKPSDGKVNEAAALRYFLRAADRGHAPAQAKVGLFYLTGRGTKKNEQLGVQWLRRAAKNGDKGAEEALKVLGITD